MNCRFDRGGRPGLEPTWTDVFPCSSKLSGPLGPGWRSRRLALSVFLTRRGLSRRGRRVTAMPRTEVSSDGAEDTGPTLSDTGPLVLTEHCVKREKHVDEALCEGAVHRGRRLGGEEFADDHLCLSTVLIEVQQSSCSATAPATVRRCRPSWVPSTTRMRLWKRGCARGVRGPRIVDGSAMPLPVTVTPDVTAMTVDEKCSSLLASDSRSPREEVGRSAEIASGAASDRSKTPSAASRLR